jgi:hypothetical protein
LRRFEASPPWRGRGLERGGGTEGAVLSSPSRHRASVPIGNRATPTAPKQHRLPSAASAATLSPTPLPSRERGYKSAEHSTFRKCRCPKAPSRQGGALKPLPPGGGEVWREGAAPKAPCFRRHRATAHPCRSAIERLPQRQNTSACLRQQVLSPSPQLPSPQGIGARTNQPDRPKLRIASRRTHEAVQKKHIASKNDVLRHPPATPKTPPVRLFSAFAS